MRTGTVSMTTGIARQQPLDLSLPRSTELSENVEMLTALIAGTPTGTAASHSLQSVSPLSLQVSRDFPASSDESHEPTSRDYLLMRSRDLPVSSTHLKLKRSSTEPSQEKTSNEIKRRNSEHLSSTVTSLPSSPDSGRVISDVTSPRDSPNDISLDSGSDVPPLFMAPFCQLPTADSTSLHHFAGVDLINTQVLENAVFSRRMWEWQFKMYLVALEEHTKLQNVGATTPLHILQRQLILAQLQQVPTLSAQPTLEIPSTERNQPQTELLSRSVSSPASQCTRSSDSSCLATYRARPVLWKFILHQLLINESDSGVEWVNESQGLYRITDTGALSELWGRQKGRWHRVMNYSTVSRSLRNYYRQNIMWKRQAYRRLEFQFSVSPCMQYYNQLKLEVGDRLDLLRFAVAPISRHDNCAPTDQSADQSAGARGQASGQMEDQLSSEDDISAGTTGNAAIPTHSSKLCRTFIQSQTPGTHLAPHHESSDKNEVNFQEDDEDDEDGLSVISLPPAEVIETKGQLGRSYSLPIMEL